MPCRLAVGGEALERRSPEQHAPADAYARKLTVRLEASECGGRDRQHARGFPNGYEITLVRVLFSPQCLGSSGQAFHGQTSCGPRLQRRTGRDERGNRRGGESVNRFDGW